MQSNSLLIGFCVFQFVHLLFGVDTSGRLFVFFLQLFFATFDGMACASYAVQSVLAVPAFLLVVSRNARSLFGATCAPQHTRRAKTRQLISMIQNHDRACIQAARGTHECFRALERKVFQLPGFSTFLDNPHSGGGLMFVHPLVRNLLTHVHRCIIARWRIHTGVLRNDTRALQRVNIHSDPGLRVRQRK
eukprot:9424497-Pyramimonas_sp.AAC.1